MIIKGKRTEYNVEIEIAPKEMIESIFEYFRLRTDYYIKDNKVYYDQEYSGGTHSWDETKLISDKIDDAELLKALQLIYRKL